MKDINQLGENEFIYVPTRKSIRCIASLLDDSTIESRWDSTTPYFNPKTKGFKYECIFTDDVYKWKSFLGKKPSLKKRVAKLESENNKKDAWLRRNDDLLQGFLERLNEIKPPPCPITVNPEIIEEKQTIDWSVPGQRLKTQDGVVVLTCNGESARDDKFCGVVLCVGADDLRFLGEYSNHWHKDRFEKCEAHIYL